MKSYKVFYDDSSIVAHLNCDLLDAHEPDRERAAVGCCGWAKSTIADPVVKASGSNSFGP